MADPGEGSSVSMASTKDGKFRRSSNGKFECLLCGRHLASKQNVLKHLHAQHGLTPVRRIQKRYLDDNGVPVPQSTLYRWKKSKMEHKDESIAKKSLQFDKTEITDHAISPSFDEFDEINTNSDSSEGCQEADIEEVNLSEDNNLYSSDILSSGHGGESGGESSSIYPEADDELISMISGGDDDDSLSSYSESGNSDSDSDDNRVTFCDLSSNAVNLTSQEEHALKMLSCFLRNNLSASTCKDILRTLKEMYPESASVQNLTYDNIWKFVDDSCVKEYHYCILCNRVFPEDCDVFNCESEGCNGYRYKGPYSAQSQKGRQPRQSFVFADVKAQLSNLLQSPGIWFNIQDRKSHLYSAEKNTGLLEDITNGEAYQKLLNEGEFLSNPHHVTAVLNTDGVNLYSSSRIELWPIFLAINELSPAVRFARDNMLLVGIWQGKGKPPFQTYLDLLSKQLNPLYDNGVELETTDRENITVKMAVLCGIFDLPAKAGILNMSYFNGAEACITCEEPGMVVSQGRGHARCYPYRADGSKIRTDTDVREAMERGSDRNRIKGFKGLSGLCSLKGYDLVLGTVPDYMHGVLLGVTKTLMYKWFSSTESGKPYFVGNQLKKISQRLQSIQPLETIERLPRDIEKHYSHFKATELQAWLLFYGVPCLLDILPDEYLAHFAALSEAVFLLLGSTISHENLSRAEFLLQQFYRRFSDLYPKGSCGLNVHNIGAHLISYVKAWGPIWAWSCFAFEDANAMLLQSVHGTGSVVRQVMRVRQAKILLRKSSVTREESSAWKNLQEAANCFTAGARQPLTEDAFSAVVLERLEVQSLKALKKVRRIVCGGQRFFSEDYSRMQKRECSTVLLHDGNVASVKYFVFCEKSTFVFAVVKLHQIQERRAVNDLQNALHLVPIKKTTDVDCVPVEDITERLLTIGTSAADAHSVFVSRLPNVHGHSIFK